MPDTKLTALTADTSPTSDDLLYVVNDPAGTPGSKKATAANVITKAHGLSDGIVKVATGTMAAATEGADYYKPSGTDVAVADGGTGASTASGARTNLGLVIGADVQELLVSGTNIKTINGTTLLGSGDLTVSGGHTIEDEGTPLATRTKLNFVGAGVTVTDDSGDDATVVTISGGGSGTVDTIVAGNNIDVDATDPANPIVSATEVSLPEYLVASSTAPADVISLADYVCDGTADQVQIQAAIDAAIAAGGGTVLLSGGTFNISAGISWAAHDINLRGQGQGATIITNSTGSANFDMITVGNRQSDGVMRNFNSVSDMTVTHAGGASTNACIKVDGGGRSSFIKNVQTNEGGIGIHFMDLDRYSIQNVDITNVRGTAMLLQVGAEGTFGKVRIEDSSMNLSDASSICVRFDTTGSTNPFDVVSFKNCLFFSTANTASTIGAQFNLGGVDIHFDNCQFESPSLAHVELNDETRVKFTTCSFIQNGTLATTSGFRLVNDNHCVIIDSCVFQKMTTVFDSISGSPSLELGGWSKNNGNITNVFSGSFGLRTGIDTAFAGDNILQLGPSDKKFTSIYLTDDAYAAGWNADFRAPTKNAVYDKIEALAATIGTGDVVGPASATDKAVAIFNTTTGKLIQNSAVIINSSNVSGVGTFTSTGLMSITRALTGGQILVSSSTTNSTDKFGGYAVRHYLSAEEPVGLIGAANGSSTNEVRIGGGFGEFNSATKLIFYTAANYNTTTGTERFSISSAGVGVFNDTGADADFRIEGDTDANNLFSDASTDRIGIGTATPAQKLDVTGSIGVSSTIELGHASDTTLSRSAAGVIAVEGVVIPSISSTNTLTNKRVTPRTGTTTSSATPTINTDNVDFYSLTAQTADITSFTTNLSGTPTEGQKLWIAITGTAARAITWGSSFEASTVALPTTTVSTNRLDVGFVWNTVTSKWRCVATC